MSAARTVQSLHSLAILVKDAGTKHGALNASLLNSREYKAIEKEASALLTDLASDKVEALVQRIEKKQAALLEDYASVAQLPYERLIAYDELSSLRLLLATERARQVRAEPAFFAWLVQDALPVVAKAAAIVIPLLI